MSDLTIEYVSISELKPAEYNPKRMNDRERKEIHESIEKFGFAQPLIVNIDGHQRYIIALEDFHLEKVPVCYVRIDSLERERELNLRFTKNQVKFDNDLLRSFFTEDQLSQVGFSESELDSIFVDFEPQPFEDENRLDKFDKKKYLVTCPKCGHEFSSGEDGSAKT